MNLGIDYEPKRIWRKQSHADDAVLRVWCHLSAFSTVSLPAMGHFIGGIIVRLDRGETTVFHVGGLCGFGFVLCRMGCEQRSK